MQFSIKSSDTKLDNLIDRVTAAREELLDILKSGSKFPTNVDYNLI